jgi:hypothetical protein
MDTVEHIFCQINLDKIMQSVELCITEPNSILNIIIFKYFSTEECAKKNIQEFSPYSNLSIQQEVDEKNLIHNLKSRITDFIYANRISEFGYIMNNNQIRISVKQKDTYYKEMVLEFYPKAFIPNIKLLH